MLSGAAAESVTFASPWPWQTMAQVALAIDPLGLVVSLHSSQPAAASPHMLVEQIYEQRKKEVVK